MRPGEFGGGQFRIHTDGTIKYPDNVWNDKVDKLKDALKYAIQELKEFGSIEAVKALEGALKNGK